MNNKIIAILFIVLFYPCSLWAACSGSSPTWTAASASSSDVTDCITAASAGDTINVPTGTANWGAGALSVPADKPLQIIGAGSANTVISLTGGTAGNPAIRIGEYKGKEYAGGGVHSATRFSGFTIQNTGQNAYQAMVAKGQGWRIDNNKFINPMIEDCGTNCMYYAVFTIQTEDSLGNTMQPYGLIDNNILYHAKINIGASTTSTQIAAWADDLDLGGITAVYIENNQFLNHATNGSDDNINKSLAIDNDNAAKRVIRYNYFYDFETNGHPWQSYGDRGPRKDEIYGNVFYRSSYMTIPSFEYVHMGAGTGIIFNNLLTGNPASGDNSYFLGMEQKRNGANLNGTTLCGRCDGTDGQYWDGDESGQSGYLCRDQVGTGGDTISWPATCPGGSEYYTQSKVPLYGWNNVGAVHGRYTVRNTDTTHIVANRDYFYEVASFNGTVGVGCGTLASRPGTCTIGVGYWVPNTTDDASATSCSNLADFTGYDATYHGAGTLYKCTATNTWEPYYTPYTYPHPLRGESDTTVPTNTQAGNSINAAGTSLTLNYSETLVKTGDGTVSLTCSGGAVTPTYASGSGTANHVYSLGRTINQGEVCTVSYTQGGNDLEDTAGNDLATYADHTIVNGSTQQTETTYDFTITVVGNGTINSSQGGIQCHQGNTPCVKTCDPGTVLTLTTIPDNGWGTGTISGTSCGATTTMSAARTCTVTFPEIHLFN